MPRSKIDDAMEMRPLIEVIEKDKKTDVIEYSEDNTTPEDLDFVRKNIYDIINTGGGALTGLADLTKLADSPRAFEVLATMIKTMIEANMTLVDLAAKKENLSKLDTPDGPSTVHNTIFLSTADMLKQILAEKEIQEGENEKNESSAI